LRRRATELTTGELRALRPVETVTGPEPFDIVPIVEAEGHVVPAEDRMAARVRWAERAKYTILTRGVPASFAPYNALIRIQEDGTEDRERDYLAQLAPDLPQSS
jgi:hypothetical protein